MRISRGGEKLASYKIQPLETKWKSLYEAHFDDYLVSLVEKTDFPAMFQDFYIEKPVFQAKEEPKRLKKMGTYVNESDIEREVKRVTGNIQGQLNKAMKDKFRGL